ncbi:MAG: hypothetical protein SNH55_01075 [Rikenellaceae bacterium]
MRVKLQTLYSELTNAALLKSVRRFVSLPFMMMLFASLVLWYIAKLSYTYTTEIEVKIKVEDQKIFTSCVVEGVGSNLIGYKIYRGGAINISLEDIKYNIVNLEGDSRDYVVIDPDMLSKAISVHYSDIKVMSVAALPAIEVSERIKRIIER